MSRKKRRRRSAGPAPSGQSTVATEVTASGSKKGSLASAGARKNRSIIIAVLAVALAAVPLLVVFSGRLFRAGSPRPAADLNVLLITLDTTRADRLGCYGHKPARTPALDALAARGVRFENAYCEVPLTLPSHATILTGLNPYRHGVHNNGNYALSPGHTTLAEVLKARGYATAAFAASFSVDSRFGLDQGFDAYDDVFEPAAPFKPVNSERRADRVFAAFKAWFEKHAGGRFFAWVHFYDPHFPYDPPEEYAREFRADPYDGEVAFMDKYVGELVRLLESEGLLDRTLIVAAGDHGEAFGEKVEEGHGLFLYEMSLRVPFIVSGPGLPRGLAVPGEIGLVDITPTVLDLLGVKPASALDGRSLAPALRGKKVPPADIYLETFYPRENYGWSELVGVLSRGWKYIQAPKPELYDLRNDPAEEKNLVRSEGGRAADLRSRLEAMLKRAAGAPSGSRALTAAEQERLRSLGYVQFAGGRDSGERPDPKDRLEELKLFQEAAGLELRGDFAGAEQAFLKLLPFAPDVASSYINLARVQGMQKKFEAAVATLQKGLEAVPGSDLLLSRLGHTYLVMGRAAEALEAMQQALAVNPANFDALVASAMVYESWGRFDDAVASLEKALTVEPENEFLRLSYAENLARGHRLKEAAEVYAGLVRDFPDNYFYLQNLGIAHSISGEHDLAIAELEKAVSKRPAPKAYLNLALSYREKGRLGDAARALESYLADARGEDPGTVAKARSELARLRELLK
jgi:arylsulfatase A-like enzyme/Flp pilus assembly protein TadD